MPFAAGQIVRASALNRIQPTTYQGRAVGAPALGTTENDATSSTILFTTTTAAVCVANAFFDFDVQIAGAAIAVGRLRIDGVTLADEAHTNMAALNRNTCGQSWRFTVSGAGSHTGIMRIIKSAAAGTAIVDDNHTKWTLTVNEIV